MVETIKHAAVKWADGVISIGRDHGVALQKRKGHIGHSSYICGFTTSTGRFVSRNVAAFVAVHAGQIDEAGEGGLHSENLWYYGPYKYDDEKGYYK